jgi:serine/threonine protein phosphatase PrpC
MSEAAAAAPWPASDEGGASRPRLGHDLVAATLGTAISICLLWYLHGRWDPYWALICGGIGGLVARRLVRPSYIGFPRYLRLPLSFGVVALGTLVASWATLVREPLSYWILRWREALTMPLLAGVLGLGLASLIYTHRRLERELASRRRIEEDLAVASRIQKNLLATPKPDFPWVGTHALNIASRAVGGDYFEILSESSDCMCFAVGDVSGKGVAAALLMSSLQSSFLAAHSVHPDLDRLCAHVNDFLYSRTTPERYATFFVGRLRSDGRLSYVNAGHNPALIVGEDRVQRLFGGGLPLGLFPKAEYTVQELDLQRGEMLLVYTDGVTEASDEDEVEFGEDRLGKAARKARAGAADEVAAAILDALASHTGGKGLDDDATLMVLQRQTDS